MMIDDQAAEHSSPALNLSLSDEGYQRMHEEWAPLSLLSTALSNRSDQVASIKAELEEGYKSVTRV
jgi:hypothetical protein